MSTHGGYVHKPQTLTFLWRQETVVAGEAGNQSLNRIRLPFRIRWEVPSGQGCEGFEGEESQNKSVTKGQLETPSTIALFRSEVRGLGLAGERRTW